MHALLDHIYLFIRFQRKVPENFPQFRAQIAFFCKGSAIDSKKENAFAKRAYARNTAFCESYGRTKLTLGITLIFYYHCSGNGRFFALRTGLNLALFCGLAVNRITNVWCMQIYHNS